MKAQNTYVEELKKAGVKVDGQNKVIELPEDRHKRNALPSRALSSATFLTAYFGYKIKHMEN